MSDWTLKTKVYEGISARQRLAELALDLDLLVEVVEKGEQARADATAHDPAIAASLDAWRYRVRGLRDAFAPGGWTAERSPSGLEYLRSPCRRRAILTRAGNSDVGVPGGRPHPLRGFGDATARALEANGSLHLDPDWQNIIVPANDTAEEDFETWMLLVYRSGDRVQAELSHPSGQGSDGRVDRWIERIILPPTDYSEHPSRHDEEKSEVEEVDVPVVRKR